jgi:hypothetical protein
MKPVIRNAPKVEVTKDDEGKVAEAEVEIEREVEADVELEQPLPTSLPDDDEAD